MRRKSETGIIITGVLFALMFIIIIGRYFVLAADTRYAEAARESRQLTIEAGAGEGNIYDRNMVKLVNASTELIAVAVPRETKRDELAGYAENSSEFLENYSRGVPFKFESIAYIEESAGLTMFRVPVRYNENQLAQHVIGYTSQGEGVAGIEYAYNNLLRAGDNENSVTYSVDGFGRVLIGDGKKVARSAVICSGVVTTLDSEIQRICENAGESIERGVIAVAEVETGDIAALASFPDYSVYNLDEAVSDDNSPMINRALYSYSVGSAFKLVTACEAIQQGYEGYMYSCSGIINVNGQKFRCHKHEGHGLQSMKQAMVNSCNTYFISLSQMLSVPKFRETAFSLGFGREIHLCSGMTASGGVLPSEDELLIPAELANFSFGQGMLTASPLQVLQMTCAIANRGSMPVLRLIRGVTENGVDVENEKEPRYAYAMNVETAEKLKEMMTAAVEESESSNAKTKFTTAAAKTSTAQTGRTDENGEELCNAWITGCFPADKPKYAITILVEDGGYGNDAAAPVFRKIADSIAKMEERD